MAAVAFGQAAVHTYETQLWAWIARPRHSLFAHWLKSRK